MARKHSLLFFTILIINACQLFAQDSTYNTSLDTICKHYNIADVAIIGNKKTKAYVIKRELDFSKGSKISSCDTSKIISENTARLVNTELFNEVDISFVELSDSSALAIIKLTERWYIFPLPIVEFVDRNFSEYLQRRTNGNVRFAYGIDFEHKNFRGRKEKLNLLLQTGFYNKYELSYNIPYIDDENKSGIDFSVSYSENKSLAYRSNENQLDYLSSDKTLRERYYAGITYKYRPEYYDVHSFSAYYKYNVISDSIAELNPQYFGYGRTRRRYFELSYSFSRSNTDATYYPLQGYNFSIEASKLGLFIGDINQFNVQMSFSKYWRLSPRLYYASRVTGKTSYPKNQAYFNILGLGYEQNYVRGYELYVVDGQDFALHRNSVRYKFLEFEIDASRFFKMKQFNKIPYAFYIKLLGDWGYVHDQTNNPLNNALTNRLLYGYGIGIDLSTYYSVVLRFEYSINHLGEQGFYLNWSKDI